MFYSTSRLLSLCWTSEQRAQLLDLERKTTLCLYPARNSELVAFGKACTRPHRFFGGTGPVLPAMLTLAALLSLCFWMKSAIGAGLTGECLKRLSITRHYVDICFPCSPITSRNVEKIRFCAAGSKCGTPQARNPMAHSLRVIGGAEARYGSHPWLVSDQPSVLHREPVLSAKQEHPDMSKKISSSDSFNS